MRVGGESEVARTDGIRLQSGAYNVSYHAYLVTVRNALTRSPNANIHLSHLSPAEVHTVRVVASRTHIGRSAGTRTAQRSS